PDFKQGFLDETPSGNIDVAPTILWILGATAPQPLDGRVLHEAFASDSESVEKLVQRKVEAARESGFFRSHQYLKFTEVGNSVYFDEGNGQAGLECAGRGGE